MRWVASGFASRLALCAALLGFAGAASAADDAASSPRPRPSRAPELPPLPEGVSALEFTDFFERPVGPRGLVPTEKLKQLAGRRVRILGYMVRREDPPAKTLILTPHPVELHDLEYGMADDLPPSALFVTAPDAFGELPYTPGLLLLTGRLELGSREEPDGRVSFVRLVLDPKTGGRSALAGAAVTVPVAPK